MNADKYAAYRAARKVLIKYLKQKTKEADWHGVSDAANDLRVMEAKHEVASKQLGESVQHRVEVYSGGSGGGSGGVYKPTYDTVPGTSGVISPGSVFGRGGGYQPFSAKDK